MEGKSKLISFTKRAFSKGCANSETISSFFLSWPFLINTRVIRRHGRHATISEFLLQNVEAMEFRLELYLHSLRKRLFERPQFFAARLLAFRPTVARRDRVG